MQTKDITSLEKNEQTTTTQTTTPAKEGTETTAVVEVKKTKVTGWKNVEDNQGLTLTGLGMGTVFIGLILIALVIRLFSIIFTREKKTTDTTASNQAVVAVKNEPVKTIVAEDVDDDVVVAIATTIELYRRLHIEDLNTKITFRHGKDIGTAWKMGNKFGYRE